MKKRKIDWERYAPVGSRADFQVRAVLVTLVLSALWSLRALFRIVDEFRDLRAVLDQGAYTFVVPYSMYLGSAFYGFMLICLVLLMVAVFNYASFRRGARTDYLMRRLPDRWEYHRRCLAVPIFGIGASVLTGLALWAIYRAVYWHLFREVTAGMEDPARLIIEGAVYRWRGLW